MRREIHENLTEEAWLAMRAEDITSTEISALFGLSPYETPFELWHRKRGNIPGSFKENDRTILGQEIEPVIARALGRKYEVEVRPFKSYIRIPDLGLGCSFDWEWLEPDTGEWINFEIKHLDFMVFKDQWKLWDGGVDLPIHIALQANYQIWVRGQTRGVVGYLAGGTILDKLDRELNQAAIEKILRKVDDFRETLARGIEPEPDFARDGDTLKALYAKPDPRATLSHENQIEAMSAVRAACEAAAAKKAAAAIEDAEKARIIALMRETPEALLPDGSKVLFRADKNGRRSLRLTAAKGEGDAAA